MRRAAAHADREGGAKGLQGLTFSVDVHCYYRDKGAQADRRRPSVHHGVRTRVHAFVRACVRACMRVCVCACVCMRAHVCLGLSPAFSQSTSAPLAASPFLPYPYPTRASSRSSDHDDSLFANHISTTHACHDTNGTHARHARHGMHTGVR